MSVFSRIKDLATGRSTGVTDQIMRYGITGVIASFVDIGTLTLLTELFGDRLLLLWTAVAFSCGLTVTYLFSVNWVFNNRTLSSRTAEIAIFIAIGIVGLGLTELLMWVFAKKLEWHYLLAKIVSGTTVFVWNFTAKKLLLFRNK